MPRLIVNAGTPQAVEFVLKPGANYVGRGFANDFKLDDASVSGSHAQFTVNGKEVTVKDLGSTNGTFVNRIRITEVVLQPGQYVRLGGIELLLQADGETEIATRAQRTQVPVSAPIVGEFRISGTPLVSGRSGDTVPQFASPASAPVAAAPPPAPSPVVAAAMPAAESPIKGLRMTTSAPAEIPAPAAATAPPAPVRIPTPQPQSIPTPPAPARMVAPAPIAAPVPRAAAVPVAQDPPPSTPVAEPPTPGMVEPPAGKTACKYHPNNPGHFLCQTCGNLFCSLCVSARRTENATGYFCRTCGTQCVPVKVRFTPKKEKGPKHYSDVTVLVRAIGFGCAGAVVAAGIWAAVGAVVGAVASFMPGILCWITGVLCGFGVKIGCQDRPGIIFSMIAVGALLLGIAMGEGAVALVTKFPPIIGLYGLVGLLAGGFSAWRIGGGDF